MTSVAVRLLDDFKKLAPEEQLLVREQVISLTESIQRNALERLRGASTGKELLAKLLEDRALCGEAAKLKASHKISFADSFVAATAKRFDATLIHKDPEFHALASIVKQKMLPPK